MAKFEQFGQFKPAAEEEKTDVGKMPKKPEQIRVEKYPKTERNIQFETTVAQDGDETPIKKFISPEKTTRHREKYKNLIEDIRNIVEGAGLEILESELEEVSVEEVREITKREIPLKRESVTNTILVLLEQNKIGEIEDKNEKSFIFNTIYGLVRRKMGDEMVGVYEKNSLADAKDEEDKKRRENIVMREISKIADKYDMADIFDYLGSDLTYSRQGMKAKTKIE